MEANCNRRRQWNAKFPIDEDGNPSYSEARVLLLYLFENRNTSHKPTELSSRLCLHEELVAVMCRQLEYLHLVVQEPKHSQSYRYDIRSPAVEFQAKVEQALIDHCPL